MPVGAPVLVVSACCAMAGIPARAFDHTRSIAGQRLHVGIDTKVSIRGLRAARCDAFGERRQFSILVPGQPIGRRHGKRTFAWLHAPMRRREPAMSRPQLIACLCWLGLLSCADASAQAPPNPSGEMEFADGQNWTITSPPLRWEIGQSGVWIIVPSGFVHDKASIPPALQSLIHKNGTYTRAAVIHDWLYWSQRCTRDEADNLLLIAMKESNVGWWDR